MRWYTFHTPGCPANMLWWLVWSIFFLRLCGITIFGGPFTIRTKSPLSSIWNGISTPLSSLSNVSEQKASCNWEMRLYSVVIGVNGWSSYLGISCVSTWFSSLLNSCLKKSGNSSVSSRSGWSKSRFSTAVQIGHVMLNYGMSSSLPNRVLPSVWSRDIASVNLFSLPFLYVMLKSNLARRSLQRVNRVEGSVIFISQGKGWMICVYC